MISLTRISSGLNGLVAKWSVIKLVGMGSQLSTDSNPEHVLKKLNGYM